MHMYLPITQCHLVIEEYVFQIFFYELNLLIEFLF